MQGKAAQQPITSKTATPAKLLGIMSEMLKRKVTDPPTLIDYEAACAEIEEMLSNQSLVATEAEHEAVALLAELAVDD
ncbi:MAG: hypothetical protein ABI541_01290, partial [Betaproteobacteria bacterium]